MIYDILYIVIHVGIIIIIYVYVVKVLKIIIINRFHNCHLDNNNLCIAREYHIYIYITSNICISGEYALWHSVVNLQLAYIL